MSAGRASFQQHLKMLSIMLQDFRVYFLISAGGFRMKRLRCCSLLAEAPGAEVPEETWSVARH